MVFSLHRSYTRALELFLIACVYVFISVVADILCEFLEVAIHLILYVREVYPSGIFQKRKKYNVPVQVQRKWSNKKNVWLFTHYNVFLFLCLFQMSCHPELNQYIQDTLHCIKPLIEKVWHTVLWTNEYQYHTTPQKITR